MRNTLLNYIYNRLSIGDAAGAVKEEKKDADLEADANLLGAISSDDELSEKTEAVRRNKAGETDF